MMHQPFVSIIVPTFNSSPTIECCLASLKFQTYPDIEIIVVDNFSKDDTVTISKKYCSKVFQIKALRSTARNYGAKNSKGHFYLFVDADMELMPDVVKECVERVVKDNIDAVMIPEIRVGEGFWAKCRAVERRTYICDHLIESARFFKKEAFDSAGGFDEKLEAGEDWDLHARVEDAGYKIGSINSFMKHLEGKVTLRKIVIKRVYYGRTLMKYIRKQPHRASIQFAPVRLNFLKQWRILVSEPSYCLGIVVLRFIEYFATAISIVAAGIN